MKTHRVDTKDYEVRFLMDKNILAKLTKKSSLTGLLWYAMFLGRKGWLLKGSCGVLKQYTKKLSMPDKPKVANVYSRLSVKTARELIGNIPNTEDVIVGLKCPEDYLIGNIESVDGKNFVFQAECGEHIVWEPIEMTVPLKRLAVVRRRPRKFDDLRLPSSPGMF